MGINPMLEVSTCRAHSTERPDIAAHLEIVALTGSELPAFEA